MKTLLKIIVCIGIAISLFQCTSKQINGINLHIADAQNLKVFLDRTQLSNTTDILGEAEFDSKGKASIVMPEDLTPGLYRLRIGAKKHQLILDGTEKNITISGSLKDIGTETLVIEGSPWTQELMAKIGDFKAQKMDVKAISEYCKSTKNPLNAIQFALSTLGEKPIHYKAHQEILNNLSGDIKDSKYYSDYKDIVKSISNAYMASMAAQRVKIGEEAPEIKMPGLDGKDMTLSSYRGKVVLVDFWASWCGPCRRSNPHLVEVYNKYKHKGFDVFSVSLDGLDGRSRNRFAKGDNSAIDKALEKQKDRWTAAIKKDNLTWAGHVSDLLKWDTPSAKQYGVTGIPKTFLIDRDGKIAALNPRYNLEEELLKIL